MKKIISFILIIILLTTLTPFISIAAEYLPVTCNLREIAYYTMTHGSYFNDTGNYIFSYIVPETEGTSNELVGTWIYNPDDQRVTFAFTADPPTTSLETYVFMDTYFGGTTMYRLTTSFTNHDPNNTVYYGTTSYAYGVVNARTYKQNDEFDYYCSSFSNNDLNRAAEKTASTSTRAGLSCWRLMLSRLMGFSLGDIGFDSFENPTYRNLSVGHDYGPWETAIEPTEYTEGRLDRQCKTCGIIDTKAIPATGHVHNLVKTAAKEATCTNPGNHEYYTCTKCGLYFADPGAAIELAKTADGVNSYPARGHSFGEWKTVVAPTETSAGVAERTCKVCGEKETKSIPVAGHNLKIVAYSAATCTKDGNVEYYTCTDCNKCFLDAAGTEEVSLSDTIIKATGHHYGDWKVTKSATEKQEGIQERTCSICGEKETKTIPATSHEQSCPSKKFSDVEKNTSNWTHLPIDYVLEHGYMTGISDSKFEPYNTVSRAMVVQVLYAMEGKPAVSSNAGFKDVVKGRWYANAVNWAASKGIVSGYTNGNFGISDPVKRQDLVAIMYKYAAYKKYDTTLNGDISKFADKSTISTYAVNGMKWGVGHSIISGINKNGKTYADPKASANRAQLAVILKAFDQNVKK